MSTTLFNGKVTLLVDNLQEVSTPGSYLTWNATFTFFDATGKWLGSNVQVGNIILVDTSALELATITTYTITSVVSSTFNSFRVVMQYAPSNTNETGAPDLSYAVGLPGLVSTTSTNKGIGYLPTPSIQLMPDALAYQLNNDNNFNVVDLLALASALSGGTAGSIPFQSAVNVTSFTTVGTPGQVLTSSGAGSPTWTTPVATGNQTITLTGDVTGSGTTSLATTLATVATAGTYTKVTIDAKGRVITGTTPTTLAGYGITDAVSSALQSSTNTSNTLVLRNASGNFSAGTITASLTGTASSATSLVGGSAGSIPYQSAAGVTSYVPGGTTGHVLTSTGPSAAPSWQAVPTPTTTTTQPAGTANTTIASTAFVDRLRSSAPTSSATAALTDRGNTIVTAAGVTVPASVFAAGDVFSVYNNSAANITITSGAGLTMYLVGTATVGNRTLAQRGIATIYFISATNAVITGGGLT